MCFQEQEERLQQLEKELSELLQILPDTEESKEVIPMMEAMITQIEEQQNIMAEMLQEIQEKDEKLMCFQEQMNLPLNEPQKTPEPTARSSTIDPGIPKALRDLMESNQVDEWDIQNVVAARGYYPSDVKVKDYDMDFINGCLIGAWPQVYGMIKEMKATQQVPFN